MGGIVEAGVALAASAAAEVSAAGAAVATSATAVAAGTATVADVALTATVVGAVTGVVGAATGNQTLSEVGMGIGVAGGITGLANAALTEAATAPTLGYEAAQSGDLMKYSASGDAFKVGAQGAGTIDAAAGAKTVAQAELAPPVAPMTSGDTALTGSAGADTVGSQATAADAMGEQASQVGPVPDAGGTPTAPTPAAPAAPAPPVAPGDVGTGAATQTGPASGRPVTAAGAVQEATGQGIVRGTTAALPPTDLNGFQVWWNKQTDFTKAMLLTQGSGALGGLTSGALKAVSASDRLKLDQLINQQRQGQIQYENRNNAYAPAVTFGPQGLINRSIP